jgi:hypothetical protein
MRRLAAVLIAVVLGALGVAGCGGSGGSAGTSPPGAGTTSSTVPAANARGRLAAAIAKLTGESYRATIDGTQSFSATGAPQEVEQALAALGGSTRVTMEAESRRRISGSFHLPIGTTVLSMQLVLYDGTVYVSRDGSDWRELGGEIASVLEPSLKAGAEDLADNLVDVRDEGRIRFEGAPAERYSGSVDPSFVLKTLAPIFQRAGLNPDLLKFQSGDGSFVVRARDGQLVQQQGSVTASIDLSKLPGGPNGTMSVQATTTVHYVDQGTDIRIARPATSGTLTTLAELGSFLTG